MRIFLLSAAVVASMLWIGAPVAWSQVQPRVPQATAPQASGGTSVAVIDIGHIFRNLDRFKAAMEDIKQRYGEFEKYVMDQRTEMQTLSEQLRSKPAGSAEYRQLEEQLADMNTKLRLEVGRKQKERVEEEAKVYFNAYREIELAVQNFADRYGVDLVIRFNSEQMDPTKPESVLQGINRFVVFHRSLNITNHILTELNGRPPQSERLSTPRGPAIPGRSTR